MDILVTVSIADGTPGLKNQLGKKKGVVSFTLPGSCPSLKEVRAETQAGQEPGSKN